MNSKDFEEYIADKENIAFIRGINAFRQEFLDRVKRYSMPPLDDDDVDWIVTMCDIKSAVKSTMRHLVGDTESK